MRLRKQSKNTVLSVRGLPLYMGYMSCAINTIVEVGFPLLFIPAQFPTSAARKILVPMHDVC